MTETALEQQLTKALAAHNRWKLRLKTAITVGKFDQSVEDVQRCDICEFGKWIEGDEVPASLKGGKPYQVTRQLHREFHKAAAVVINHATNGRTDRAQEVMEGAYAERTEKLTRAITRWRSEIQT